MADPRFYDSKGPFSIARIEQLTKAALKAGDREVQVWDLAPLDRAASRHLAYCEGPRFGAALRDTKATAVFVTPQMAGRVPEGVLALECTKPAMAFAQMAHAFYPDAALLWSVNQPPVQSISPSARIGEGTVIAPGVFLGENVEIGRMAVIGPGSVIGRGVQIGNGTHIGAHVSISHALIGDNCSIHPGARIGQDGFGYVNTPAGHFKIPQLGRVIIQDNVVVGANVTIDRGAMSDTVVGEGTRFDNLVQIAHNARTGRHCIIVSQAGLSGSAEIEDFVVIGGQVGVSGHVKVGKGALIAGKSGVTRSLEGGKVYGGFPARPIEQWRREVGVVARMAKAGKSKTEQTDND